MKKTRRTSSFQPGGSIREHKTRVPAAGMELLAPAGKWEVLERVVAEGADAVYLGSKSHNMRLFRRDFNFTWEEIEKAAQYVRQQGVKLYITLNNLLFPEELEEIRPYLKFLQQVRPHALIVQDLGLIQLIRDLGVTLPLHASVMMNIHSSPAVKLLQGQGVTRVILSRDISLAEAREINQETGMELEYFIHGDMCFCQSGQCYHSGMVFGESSNRGRCLKTCRWPYRLWDREGQGVPGLPRDKSYPLAVKDMCMLPFIPEMARSGICSLKVEGRMRTAEYLGQVTRAYREALDLYARDPGGYSLPGAAWEQLYKIRVRDFSAMYAFNNPGPASIGYSGHREPRFFSHAPREKEISKEDIKGQVFAVRLGRLGGGPGDGAPALPLTGAPPRLSARVGNIQGMVAAARGGADLVYIGGETFVSSGGRWSPGDLYYGLEYGREAGVQVVMTTPRVTQGQGVARVVSLLDRLEGLKPDGLLVGNLGTLELARQRKGLPLYGDFSLNGINGAALRFLKKQGVRQLTVQPETSFEQVALLLREAVLPLEVLAHGPLVAMVSDHCLAAGLLENTTRHGGCSFLCREKKLSLLDEKGQEHPVEVDEDCRNHIFLANQLALLPFLQSFVQAGAASFCLELRTYTPEEVGRVTALYRKHLDLLQEYGEGYRFERQDWKKLRSIHRGPYGFGGYLKGVRVKRHKRGDRG